MMYCSLKYLILRNFNEKKHWVLSYGLCGHKRPSAASPLEPLFFLLLKVCMLRFSFTILRSFKPQELRMYSSFTCADYPLLFFPVPL